MAIFYLQLFCCRGKEIIMPQILPDSVDMLYYKGIVPYDIKSFINGEDNKLIPQDKNFVNTMSGLPDDVYEATEAPTLSPNSKTDNNSALPEEKSAKKGKVAAAVISGVVLLTGAVACILSRAKLPKNCKISKFVSENAQKAWKGIKGAFSKISKGVQGLFKKAPKTT